MTRYELFKLLHVVGAIGWVGGGLGLLVLSHRLVAAGDHAALMAMGRQSKSLGTWLFMPAALLTLLFGVLMVATEARLGFTDLWILIGFGGVLASGIVQPLLAEPAAKRFEAAVTEHGLDHPAVSAAARRLSLGSALDVGLLLIVVWAMVAKPTL